MTRRHCTILAFADGALANTAEADTPWAGVETPGAAGTSAVAASDAAAGGLD
jgi:hypothetical protein